MLNDVFQIHTIKDGAAYDFDEVHFSFFAVKHLIESYGVRISAEGKTLPTAGIPVCARDYTRLRPGRMRSCVNLPSVQGNSGGKPSPERAYRGADCQGCGRQTAVYDTLSPEQAQALLQEARQVFPDAVLTQIESAYAVGEK